jgi:hypothetical protein
MPRQKPGPPQPAAGRALLAIGTALNVHDHRIDIGFPYAILIRLLLRQC